MHGRSILVTKRVRTMNAYIHTLLQRRRSCQSDDTIRARSSIRQKVHQRFPNTRILGRGKLFRNPLANQPRNAAFDDRITGGGRQYVCVENQKS